MVRVVRGTKSDVQSVPCYCLNHGYNLSAANVKVIKAKTGGVCYTSDIVWTVPHTTAMPPAPAGGGSEGLSTPATPGRAITYVPHPPPPSSPLLSVAVTAVAAATTTFVVAAVFRLYWIQTSTVAPVDAATAASAVVAAAAALVTAADIWSHPFENGTVLRHADG